MAATERRSQFDLPLVLTITTIALWALNIPVVKVGLEGWAPMAFSFFRFGIGALLYIAYVLLREGSLRIERRDIPLFVAGGLTGIALNQFAFMYALETTSASIVTLFFATTPLWAALLARLLGWEFVKPLFWVAVAVSIVGVFLVVLGTGAAMDASSAWGLLLAVGAPLTWGCYSVIIRPLLSRYSAAHVSALMMAIGAPVVGIVGLPQLLGQDFAAFSASSWVAMAYALVASLVVANLLWFIAIHKAGSARAVALMPLQPFLGVVFSALLLDETLDWKEGVGGVIIVIAVAVAVRNVVPVDRAHDPREIGIQE